QVLHQRKEFAMPLQPILSGGNWIPAAGPSQFQGFNPRTMVALPDNYPISTWADLDPILDAAHAAFEQTRKLSPEQRASFLERYATEIEKNKEALAALGEQETALPSQARLLGVEIPRTIDQLRQAARAAKERSWTMATIDTAANLRSMYIPFGPVVI